MFGWRKHIENIDCKDCSDSEHHVCHHRKKKCIKEVREGEKCLIQYNKDKKTIEMGLYSGNVVKVMKNEDSDHNIIICVGESRYIIPKETAEKIEVK